MKLKHPRMRYVRTGDLIDTIEAALDYFEGFGTVISVALFVGPDGYMRGGAMIKETNE